MSLKISLGLTLLSVIKVDLGVKSMPPCSFQTNWEQWFIFLWGSKPSLLLPPCFLVVFQQLQCSNQRVRLMRERGFLFFIFLIACVSLLTIAEDTAPGHKPAQRDRRYLLVLRRISWWIMIRYFFQTSPCIFYGVCHKSLKTKQTQKRITICLPSAEVGIWSGAGFSVLSLDSRDIIITWGRI